ncbi:MAG: PTS sugar transporter subunit IIA [Rhodospirillales bacterium]|nr:PTS sugar transporter subunit IIA [Rhodospirillales bacterium]
MTTYSCDLDFFKAHFPAQSAGKLYADIARQVSLQWENPDLFDTIQFALSESAARNEFIFEDGVMIANVMMDGIDHPVHMLYKIPEGLDMKSSTGDEHVTLVFVLLSPLNENSLHLRRLSRISRLMRDRTLCDRLRQINDLDTVRAMFLYTDLDEQAA